MPRSAAVHPTHRATVRDAFKRNGILSQSILAARLELSLSTVNNFCRGANIYVSNFEDISEALGLDPSLLTLDADAPPASAPAAPSSPPPELPSELAANFFAYDPLWVGRDALSADLLNKLQGACRLLFIVFGCNRRSRLKPVRAESFSPLNRYLRC